MGRTYTVVYVVPCDAADYLSADFIMKHREEAKQLAEKYGIKLTIEEFEEFYNEEDFSVGADDYILFD